MLKGLSNGEGHEAGRYHVATLMKRMAVAAIYRRPNTSKPVPGHTVYPYLLRNQVVTTRTRLGDVVAAPGDGMPKTINIVYQATDGAADGTRRDGAGNALPDDPGPDVLELDDRV